MGFAQDRRRRATNEQRAAARRTRLTVRDDELLRRDEHAPLADGKWLANTTRTPCWRRRPYYPYARPLQPPPTLLAGTGRAAATAASAGVPKSDQMMAHTIRKIKDKPDNIFAYSDEDKDRSITVWNLCTEKKIVIFDPYRQNGASLKLLGKKNINLRKIS